MKKLKNPSCDKTKKLKLLQNSETQIGTKLKKQKKSNKKFFGNNDSTPWLLMRCFWGSLLQSCDVFIGHACKQKVVKQIKFKNGRRKKNIINIVHFCDLCNDVRTVLIVIQTLTKTVIVDNNSIHD